MNATLHQTADSIGEWLPTAYDVEIDGRTIRASLTGGWGVAVTLDDTSATVTLLRGWDIVGEQTVSFADPNVRDYLVAQATTAYGDMIAAGVLA